jgi:hypothetical protein
MQSTLTRSDSRAGRAQSPFVAVGKVMAPLMPLLAAA